MSLGVNGIKGKRGLPRTGQPGKNHQLVPRDSQINIFQIMDARALDFNEVGHFLFLMLSIKIYMDL